MKRFLHLFHVNRGEWPAMIPVLLVVLTVNLLVIVHYWPLFSQPSDSIWGPFPSNFHVSGFDALLYTMSSRWNIFYNICFRHPLMAYLLIPTWAVTRVLLLITGYNCVQWVLGVQLVFCAFYGFLFFYRLLHDVLHLTSLESSTLVWLLLSFAMVMLSTAVPDHFVFSFFLLLLTLWLAGQRISSGKPLTTAETFWLFILTAGVTLTNGVKTLLAQWLADGRRVFRLRNVLVLAVGGLLIWGVGKISYELIVKPDIEARTAAKQKSGKQPHPQAPSQKQPQKDGQKSPLSNYLQWADTTTPRWTSFRENFMGETLILHRSHLLEDIGTGRPIFVAYSSSLPYIIEAFLVLLALLGFLAAFRQRLAWLALSWITFDAVIHFVFGFGLNEVYIMACHWAFLLPLMIGYLIARLTSWARRALTLIILLIAASMLTYNLTLIASYLI